MAGASATRAERSAPGNAFGLAATLPSGSRGSGVCAALVVGLAALAARPFSTGMFGYQFSYARTAFEFARTGHFVYNGWATAMLGWQILWADLFLRVFRVSFDVLRLSVLTLGVLSVYLFHQVLVRFGLHRRLAFFGALTLGLTPLFLPLAASFMSDVPGLFVTLLCLALCQRAAIASTGAGSIAWLAAASATNVVGGTARQICWLGVLVMVPCTAWLLRRRRGVFVSGCVCALVGAAAVRGLLHWFARQPHAVPEHMNLRATTLHSLGRLGESELRCGLFLVLITAPAGVALLGTVRQLSRGALLRIGAAMLVVVGVFSVAGGRNAVASWSLPWLEPILRIRAWRTEGPRP